MNKHCISCGRLLNKEESIIHNSCKKLLFGRKKIPNILFPLNEISLKAQEMVGKLSISGVQPKLSVRLNKGNNNLEIVSNNGTYILKPQTDSFPNLPENENLFMTIFQIVGIDTARHTLIKLADGTDAYLVKRFDRTGSNKHHFEDFQSILDIGDKYGGSIEKIGKGILKYARFPGLAIQEFYKSVITNFIIGNGDAHLKNYGLLYNVDGLKSLSPAYDIVCSKLVINDEEDSAIPINGKRRNISKKDLFDLGIYFEIQEKVINGIFKDIFSHYDLIVSFIKDYPYLTNQKNNIINIINNGFNVIYKNNYR